MKKTLLFLAVFTLGTTAFSQIPNYVPSNGLVGWWPFNGNANDESGNGNNGTVNGGTFSNDRFNLPSCALSLDGASWIDVGNLNLGQVNSSYTYANWFKTNAQGAPHRTMIADYNSSSGDDNVFACWHMLENNNLARTEVRNFPSGYGVTSINPVNDNQWHFMLTVLDRNVNEIRIYMDGTLICSIIIPSNLNLNENGFLRFGIHKWNNIFQPSLFWLGSLDDIGIWNRALTECEIQDLYHAQLNSASLSISAGADQSICAGANVTLNGAGGSNYLWNNNVVDGQAFAPAQSNAYVVTAQDTLGCTGTDTVVVTVLENATSTLTQTALDSYTLNGQTYTQSGTYTQTLTATNGCDSTITLHLTLNFTGIDELGTGAKKLVKITDLNGKTIPRRKNTLMLFIYEDGTVERVLEMEE